MITISEYEEILMIIYDTVITTGELGEEFTEEEARACDQSLTEIAALIDTRAPHIYKKWRQDGADRDE
jgi:hypothetical protein